MSAGRPYRLGRTASLLGLMLCWQLLAPRPAAAYLDPLSGSIVVQVLAAAALGAAVGVRRSWQSILRVVRKLTGRAEP